MKNFYFLLAIINSVVLGIRTTYNADVIVYESTPSGIMAAVAASNNTNLNVILLSTTSHIGGMCSGGLGRTDTGNKSVIGGLANEFFIRNGAVYNKSIEYTLEPHVAKNIFIQMLNESNVSIIIDSAILTSNINPDTHTITSFTTVNGNEYISKIYIDASYEGDLFGNSGVSFHLGRESSSLYNETYNGRSKPTSKNNFAFYVNPYDDNNNLLPLVTPFDNEILGQSDDRIESMNYRLCVTKDLNNRIPFKKPDSYNSSRWELLRRLYAIKPLTTGQVPSCNCGDIPNNKYDMNNCGPISTDFLGQANNYINASYQQRDIVRAETRNYTLELLWFLCSDDSVPQDVQNIMNNEWGWCADEFVNNNYFPPQIYIREGRRMINNDFVFTQNTAINNSYHQFYYKNQSIGLGSYNFDAHNVQRFACKNSSICYSKPGSSENTGCTNLTSCPYAWNEGDVEINPGHPYEIPYMVLTPTKNEVNNLLVSVGISSSHIGFATLRLEPQWMIMGQSAGVAATILIKNGNQNNVQNINLAQLKQELLKQGQYLSIDQMKTTSDCLMCYMEDI